MSGATIFTASTQATLLQTERLQGNIHHTPSAYPRSDALGTVGVGQRVPRLLESNGSGADVRDHDRPAVAAQGVLSIAATRQV